MNTPTTPTNPLTDAQLARLQKRRWRVMRSLETLAKSDPEMKPLEQTATQLWMVAHCAEERVKVAAAVKRDAGAECFRVFWPEGYGAVREVVRTPNLLREISHYSWKSMQVRVQVTAPDGVSVARAFEVAMERGRQATSMEAERRMAA